MKTVGILGGGQLARMMILAGAPLGLRFRIYDPSPEACAGQLAPLVTGQFDDLAALQAFAASVDVITFDFENVPAASVAALSALRPVFPNAGALAVAQDRLSEKQLFQALGIALPAFADIDSLATLQARVAEFGMPCILKTRRLGYDGKGQFRIRSQADIGAAWQVYLSDESSEDSNGRAVRTTGSAVTDDTTGTCVTYSSARTSVASCTLGSRIADSAA